MPFFWDREHYYSIVAILRAGDIEAKVVSTLTYGVAVRTEDDRTIVWSNGMFNGQDNTGQVWAYSVVQDDGSLMVGKSALPYESPAEAVALMIATYDYDGADTVNPSASD